MTYWIETIELRTAEKQKAALEDFLDNLVLELSHSHAGPIVHVYNNLLIAGDYAIHMVHRQKPIEKGSLLALQVISALKTYGLVNHAIWLERSINQ